MSKVNGANMEDNSNSVFQAALQSNTTTTVSSHSYVSHMDECSAQALTWVESGTLENESQGSTLSIHDLNYEVYVMNGLCEKKTRKVILREINGIFKPGMNAILGPTGSGKSSLLDVLAGRKSQKGLSGNLLIDGSPPPVNYKCMVGYVVQDDVVMGTLTVRENLQFSAALRLPSSTSKTIRNNKVDQVINELGLTHCAQCKVGNEFIRGISGGERKRTNIGMELVIMPSVLFLDEPTTGLDAFTATSVIRILKRLARRGRTIIFSIHQPRFSIFRLFDNMILLSLGVVVYHGPATEAVDYFKTLGYECEEHNNPPDFFLDVINGDLSTVMGLEEEPADRKHDDNLQQKLMTSYKESTWYEQIMNETEPIHTSFQDMVHGGSLQKPLVRVEFATSFCRQLMLVSGRSIKNILRNPETSIVQILVMIVFGLIVGGIYWQLDTSAKSGIQNRVGAFFFIIMNQIFGNLSAVELFIKERTIFVHENSSGFYRVSAFFLAKVFCDLLPMRLIPVIVFSSITYWMIGFKREVGAFFIYFLTLFLTTAAASGISFCVSASVKIFAMANLLIALCYVFMMVFSGLLVNLSSIADWLRWIRYFSIFRYGLMTLQINELKDQVYCDPKSANTTTCVYGNYYLITQGISYETTWDLWQNLVALASMTLVFLFLAYIQLLRIKKLK